MSANSHFCAVILLETLASGEDQGLEAAHVHFHKAVEQKRGVIFNTTLANVQNIHLQVTSLQDFAQARPSRSGCALETAKTVFPHSAGEQRRLTIREKFLALLPCHAAAIKSHNVRTLLQRGADSTPI